MATTEMPTVADSADLHEQLRAAIDLLQRIADDWRLLDRLTAEDRRGFHRAIARLSEPDPRVKRKRQKAAKAASHRQLLVNVGTHYIVQDGISSASCQAMLSPARNGVSSSLPN